MNEKIRNKKLKKNSVQDNDYSKAGIRDLNQQTKVKCSFIQDNYLNSSTKFF